MLNCIDVTGIFEVFEYVLFALDDDDDENDTNNESIATKSQMADLCSEAAKLKSMSVMSQVTLTVIWIFCLLNLVICLHIPDSVYSHSSQNVWLF